MKRFHISIIAATTVLCVLALHSVSRAQAQAAPANPAAPASAVDPNTQIEVSLDILTVEPGVYKQVRHLPNGKTATGDQIYADLIKAGASEVMTPRIFTNSGVPASITETTQVPYNGTENGKPKILTVAVGTTVAATPRLMPDGTVQLSVELTKTDIANDTKPGGAPVTHTENLSTYLTVTVGQYEIFGDLKSLPRFGQPQDEIVFARVLSIKHLKSDTTPPAK